ncbi:MAG: GNAT family N-acetyltransferase, partial [Rubrobacteraceae bacterium]
MNSADYSDAQLQAWSPEVPNPSSWHDRMSTRHTLVAVQDDRIIAFAELEEDGHLDMFYVHKDTIGRGIGARPY